ncbi:MAG: phage recombination protein Bet [Brevundimonas sp.]|nr:MAG: phage recombination protein Bet [Brevundimonas sp.]
MSNVVALSPQGALSHQQIQLIRRTIANDCNDAEFDLFMAAARSAGLDPFRKQISPLVFNKNKPEKRRMSIITTIDGLRVIAARSGRYRPDEDEPEFFYDPEEKGLTNPLGITRARVRIYIDDKPVTGVAYWSEFAPISEEWAQGEDGRRRPTGKMVLDTGGNWARMPRIMLAKCAEAQALRKAFPEDTSGLYEAAELDQARVVEVLPSEAVAVAERDQRLARIGGANGIMLQLFPNAPLELVPLGRVHDRAAERVSEIEDMKILDWFEGANKAPLQEFWARSPGDALELKKVIERQRVLINAQVPE